MINTDKTFKGKQVRVIYSGGKLRIEAEYIGSNALGVLVGDYTDYRDAVYIPWTSVVCIEVVEL